MKLISWNVNGLRACINKGFIEFFNSVDSDIFAIQETKMQENQLDENIKKLGNYQYFNSAVKKGYSGTAVFTKEEPISVKYGIDENLAKEIVNYKSNIDYTVAAQNVENELKIINKKEIKIDFSDEIKILENESLLFKSDEGRLITLEFPEYYFVNCYIPNSKRGLERLLYRMAWEDEIGFYLLELKKHKPVVYCGDLNVAHQEIDLKNPKTNHHNAGFTDEERDRMSQLLNAGFIDSFRYKYPDKADQYSWWSYMFKSREKNAGWRIDYFIVSDDIKNKIVDAKIHNEIFGSDHCPIELDLK